MQGIGRRVSLCARGGGAGSGVFRLFKSQVSTNMHSPFEPLHGSHAALSATRSPLGTGCSNACARRGPPLADGHGMDAPRKRGHVVSSKGNIGDLVVSSLE